MLLDDETYALLTGAAAVPTREDHQRGQGEVLFAGRWALRTTSSTPVVDGRRPYKSRKKDGRSETNKERYAREKKEGKSEAWKRSHKKYRASAKGKAMVKRRNENWFYRLKLDEVRYEAWLKKNRDSYAKRKAAK